MKERQFTAERAILYDKVSEKFTELHLKIAKLRQIAPEVNHEFTEHVFGKNEDGVVTHTSLTVNAHFLWGMWMVKRGLAGDLLKKRKVA